MLWKIYSGKHPENEFLKKKEFPQWGANRLEMHCKHKRVFEGGNRVRKESRGDRGRERKGGGGGGGKGRRCEDKNYLHGPLDFCPFAFFKIYFLIFATIG